MAFYEEPTLEKTVNRKGSKLWTQMNDNSKSALHRQQFIQQHGGFFTLIGKYWNWTSAVKEKNGYWLKRVDSGEKIFFENMSEFAKSNGMTAVKICELLNGKRKTYKGWTAIEIRGVKDSVGSFEKIKEPKAKKIPVTKTAILVDITTNEQIFVDNISQFAKRNGLGYSNLKALIKGRSKTYKNLKVYNPLEQYKDFSEPK